MVASENNTDNANEPPKKNDILHSQLNKLNYDNNFDQAYNQVNELMINNLIDDQTSIANKSEAGMHSNYQHYLLLGGGECFNTRSSYPTSQ